MDPNMANVNLTILCKQELHKAHRNDDKNCNEVILLQSVLIANLHTCIPRHLPCNGNTTDRMIIITCEKVVEK